MIRSLFFCEEPFMRIESLLPKLSMPDLKRLMRAKSLASRRDALSHRRDLLAARIRAVEIQLGRLDRKITRLMRNGRAAKTTAARRNSGGRRKLAKARKSVTSVRAAGGPRKGSLRAYLHAALASGTATAKELAARVVKAGYATKSNAETFAHAVRNALYGNREFSRLGKGRFALTK
jgi:hypothetical protein